MLNNEIKKGQIIIVKSAPIYKNEYEYVITKAGSKIIEAILKGSEKVKKNWKTEEFLLLVEHSIIRFKSDN